jgi:hypothetical protein
VVVRPIVDNLAPGTKATMRVILGEFVQESANEVEVVRLWQDCIQTVVVG